MAVSLTQICQAEGIDEDISEYFGQVKGIWSAGVLANWIVDDTTLDAIVAQHAIGFDLFTNTPKVKTVKITSPDEKSLLRACLKQLWNRSTLLNAQSMQLTTIVPVATPAAAIVSAPVDDKVPTRLPSGRWFEMVSTYNKKQVDGKDRRFPEHTVLGAEQVLARMDHEHRVSKTYTPVGLGEIMQKKGLSPHWGP